MDSDVMDIFAFLDEHAVAYERHDHAPVYTVAEAKRLVPPMQGAHTKNLFLRNKSGARHWLVIVPAEKQVDLQALAVLLGEKRLGLASPERLMRFLGVEPGAVSPLAIVNDIQGEVAVLLDASLWQEERLKCHPLVNTSTLAISVQDLIRLGTVTGHTLQAVEIPARA